MPWSQDLELSPDMLTLSLRTCSVYFANGSAIDVAKIEGSTSYEAAMRHIQATDEVYHPETPVALDTFLLRLQHYLPTRPFLRSALNIWHHQGPDAAAVRAMLLALKSAAESYLETPVPVADLVIP